MSVIIIVKYKTANVMFNLFHGILPIQLQRRFTQYSSVHSTRQNNSFVMVQVRTNIKAMCLSVYGVKLWNTLLGDTKNYTSVNIFKKCLKTYSLSLYYTSNNNNNKTLFIHRQIRDCCPVHGCVHTLR